MAKRHRKNSPSGLGILDGLIDLAAGAAMNVVANRMEKKYHYSAKGKINPYRVSAIGIASGHLKSTRDIMRTGAYLGAKGSFNVTTDPPGRDPNESRWSDNGEDFIVSDDPLLNAISDTVEHDNRYAWRMNCEDGSMYGVYPEDYETREEYNLALEEARIDDEQNIDEAESSILDSSSHSIRCHSDKDGSFCLISRLDNGKTERHWISKNKINIGDIVTINEEDQNIPGVVVSVEDELN